MLSFVTLSISVIDFALLRQFQLKFFYRILVLVKYLINVLEVG